ncbi:MAG: MFS transporter [Chloroflexi bacterium]|nr:MFS transporter [Chloroflexota bacterium]
MRRDTRVTWTLAACTALALFGDATMYAVLPSQYATLGLTAASVGWLLSINRLVRPPLNFVTGWLTDRVGPNTPYIAGIGVGVLSTAGYGLVRGFWPLLALRALWGVAWALLAVAAYAMILDVSVETTRGRLTGLYASFSFFGGAVGPLLGGFLVDAYGFRVAMVVLGACTAVGCAGALTLPSTRAASPGPQPAPSRDAPTLSAGARARAIVRSARSAARAADRRLWLIAALNFAHRFFFAGVFAATFGRYLLATFGEDIEIGTLVLGVAGLTGTLLFIRNLITVAVGPALGYLSDRLRDRPAVLILGEVVGVLGLSAFALGHSLWTIGLGVLLAAVAYGVVPPLLVAWMGDLSSARGRGPLVGAYQTMGDLGSGLAPVLAYPLLDSWGVRPVYGASAAFLAITVPLILISRRWGAARAENVPESAETLTGECIDSPSA